MCILSLKDLSVIKGSSPCFYWTDVSNTKQQVYFQVGATIYWLRMFPSDWEKKDPHFPKLGVFKTNFLDGGAWYCSQYNKESRNWDIIEN